MMSATEDRVDSRRRVKELEDEVARLAAAIEQTIAAVEAHEPVPIKVLHEALGGRFNRRWSKEKLIACVIDWAALYGAPPKAHQWNTRSTNATVEDRERFYSGDWPTYSTIKRHFPSWNALIEAAGFEPRTGPETRGGHDGGSPADKWPEWEGYRLVRSIRSQRGWTQAQLARRANCSAAMIGAIETRRAGGHVAPPNPSVRLLLSLARALKVKPEGLLGTSD